MISEKETTNRKKADIITLFVTRRNNKRKIILFSICLVFMLLCTLAFSLAIVNKADEIYVKAEEVSYTEILSNQKSDLKNRIYYIDNLTVLSEYKIDYGEDFDGGPEYKEYLVRYKDVNGIYVYTTLSFLMSKSERSPANSDRERALLQSIKDSIEKSEDGIANLPISGCFSISDTDSRLPTYASKEFREKEPGICLDHTLSFASDSVSQERSALFIFHYCLAISVFLTIALGYFLFKTIQLEKHLKSKISIYKTYGDVNRSKDRSLSALMASYPKKDMLYRWLVISAFVISLIAAAIALKVNSPYASLFIVGIVAPLTLLLIYLKESYALIRTFNKIKKEKREELVADISLDWPNVPMANSYFGAEAMFLSKSKKLYFYEDVIWMYHQTIYKKTKNDLYLVVGTNDGQIHRVKLNDFDIIKVFVKHILSLSPNCILDNDSDQNQRFRAAVKQEREKKKINTK